MGVDLMLLPVDTEKEDGTLICSRWFILDLSFVIARIHDIEKQPVVGRVYWPIEPIPTAVLSLLPAGIPWPDGQPLMFGLATQNPIFYVLAKDVRKVFEVDPIPADEINDFEKAAIAYISSLFDTTKILLHWC